MFRHPLWEITPTDGLDFPVSGTPAVTGYVIADRFMSDGETHPFVGGVDPAVVLTPNRTSVLFSIRGGPGDDDANFPERGHYVMARMR